jgi:hypothetical protein
MRKCEHTPIVKQYITACGEWIELIKLSPIELEFTTSDEKNAVLKKKANEILQAVLTQHFIISDVGDVAITDLSHGPIRIFWKKELSK